MKTYRVVVSDDAKADLRRYRDYLLNQKKSRQAAENLVLDFRETRKQLEKVAGSLQEPNSEALRDRGLKGDTVYITNMFHSLEDYENKLR